MHTCILHAYTHTHTHTHTLYRAGKNEVLNNTCSSNLKKFEICLEQDDHTFRESVSSVVSNIFSLSSETNCTSGSFLLPPDLLLKVSALSILPSYSLRQLGKSF